jgi:hypothetical protein
MALPRHQILCPGGGALSYLVVMTCPDCRERLDDTPIDQPCPQCGGSRRDAIVTPPTAIIGVNAPRPAIVIGYDQPRPWQQKWQAVLYELEQMERAYTGESSQGNQRIQQIIEDFFRSCRELADWLWQDKQTNLTESVVMQFVWGDRDLRVADGMAQTIKHHTRTRGTDPITASIASTSEGPDGARVVIHWSRPSLARSYSRDALKLARRCVRSWRGFLVRKGLKP